MNLQVTDYDVTMSTPATDGSASMEPRWLSPAQLDAWKTITLMSALLPTALEQQLKCDSNLSYVEYYVLAGLSDQPSFSMRLSQLAVLTNAELSRLSHLISRLERRGFVTRQTDPTDGRYTTATLTEAGYAHLVAAAPGHVARVRELVIDAFDGPELRAFQNGCARIIDRIIDTDDGL